MWKNKNAHKITMSDSDSNIILFVTSLFVLNTLWLCDGNVIFLLNRYIFTIAIIVSIISITLYHHFNLIWICMVIASNHVFYHIQVQNFNSNRYMLIGHLTMCMKSSYEALFDKMIKIICYELDLFTWLANSIS